MLNNSTKMVVLNNQSYLYGVSCIALILVSGKEENFSLSCVFHKQFSNLY